MVYSLKREKERGIALNGFKLEKNGDCFCCGNLIGNIKRDDSVMCIKCENLYFVRNVPQKTLGKYINQILKRELG